MGLERGAVGVSGRVRRGFIPLFHQKILALELEQGVGATRWGGRVYLADEVLGGHWEGFKPAGAQDKQHGVWEGVKGELGPVLRERSWLEPR